MAAVAILAAIVPVIFLGRNLWHAAEVHDAPRKSDRICNPDPLRDHWLLGVLLSRKQVLAKAAMRQGGKTEDPRIRPKGLQLDEPRERQGRYWRIQHRLVGLRAVMLLAIGLTGNGGIFHRRAVQFAHARAEMPRVARWEGKDKGAVIFDTPADRHQIRIAQPFFDRLSVERSQPGPEPSGGRRAGDDLPTAGPALHQVGTDLRALHFGRPRFEITTESETRRITLIVIP